MPQSAYPSAPIKAQRFVPLFLVAFRKGERPVAGPAAFMSYVRFDDAHDDGQLSAFRERLAGEIRIQTGTEFPIFQDRNDIAWGQNWRQRIEEALDEVTLLLVIVTPGLFHSPACRGEVARFREREQTLGRDDLILPVYYVSAREMDDPGLRKSDDLASVLWERQYADWRELRFEPLTSPVVRKQVAALATRMRDSFWQDAAKHTAQLGPLPQPAGSSAARREAAAAPIRPHQDTARTEPPTHIVDAYQRGDFATVGEAIKAAKPGDRILVRPGLYEESLVVDKPLEIIGDGPVEDIEIRGRDAYVLEFRATIGRVANLTLRQAEANAVRGVVIYQGRLDLEGCDISSRAGACVYIQGADPRLRRNKIHDGKYSGVYIYDDGLGTLEDNEITGNGTSGVQIGVGGDPVLRRNQIHDNEQDGVYVRDTGLGTLEDNEISSNGYSGVAIQTAGDPVLRRNQIHDNEDSGVVVSDDGVGTVEDNEITGNGDAGVEITSGGNATVRGNRINRNRSEAVWVYDGGKGVIEDNDVTGNTKGPWDIDEDCAPNVTRARNKE
jgi:parallel beta-helix repeat protein